MITLCRPTPLSFLYLASQFVGDLCKFYMFYDLCIAFDFTTGLLHFVSSFLQTDCCNSFIVLLYSLS